jgi:hypothetical protein
LLGWRRDGRLERRAGLGASQYRLNTGSIPALLLESGQQAAGSRLVLGLGQLAPALLD